MKNFKLMVVGIGLISLATTLVAKKDDSIKKNAIGSLEEGTNKSDILGDVDPVKEWNNLVLFEKKRLQVLSESYGKGLSPSDKKKLIEWTAFIAAHRQMLGEGINDSVLDSISPHVKTFWPKRAIAFALAQGALQVVNFAGIDYNSPEYHKDVLNVLKELKTKISQEEKVENIRETVAASGVLNPFTVAQAHVFDGFFYQGEDLKNAYLEYLTRLIADFEKRKKNDDDGNGGAPSSPMMAGGI